MNTKIIYILFLPQCHEIILPKYNHHQSNNHFNLSVSKLNYHFHNMQISNIDENKQLMVF